MNQKQNLPWLSEEEPSFTTVSKEELSERSAEVQQGNT
jgi:hypothetical protein